MGGRVTVMVGGLRGGIGLIAVVYDLFLIKYILVDVDDV